MFARKLFKLSCQLIILLFVALLSTHAAYSQQKFVLKGVILHDKKPQNGAKVLVQEGTSVVDSTITNPRGKYLFRLPLGKNYQVTFRQKGLGEKVIFLSTVFPPDIDKKLLRKNIIVTLNKETKKNGPVASYKFNPQNGGFMDYELDYTDRTKREVAKVDEKRHDREKKESELLSELNKLDPEQRKLALAQLDSVNRLMDNLFEHARVEAEQIVNAAKAKRHEILEEVQQQSVSLDQMDKYLAGKLPTPEEIERFYIDREKFMVRQDIRKRQEETLELMALRERSKEDSLKLLENSVFINTELVKTARYQLEIDRLNARTLQDSILIAEKEAAIAQAEQEINLARTRLELQRYEIRTKNIVLLSVAIGLLLLAVLLLLFINKNRERARMNYQLAERSKEIARQNENIVASINYAKNIQQTILPANFATDIVNDFFILFKPKDIVSGDFFWFWQTKETAYLPARLYVAAVDCTGHGVPGAFMSLIGNRLLNEIVRVNQISQPADILTQLDKELVAALNQKETENRDGMDVSFCMIENLPENKKRVTYAGAKRPLIYIDDDTKELKSMKGDRRSIGGMLMDTEKPFNQQELILPANSLLYLTSDGYIDQSSEQRKKFGSPRLHALLGSSTSLSMAEQLDLLENELKEHQRGSEQRDDITIVGLRL